MTRETIQSIADEYVRYRMTAEKALAQLSEDELNAVPGEGLNSVAMIVRHLGGNLRSRFTDFLSSDGEKPWRNREDEFARGPFPRADVEVVWQEGLAALETALASLSDVDLTRGVTIRGTELTVREALARSLAHFAYHVGQIVLLARLLRGTSWEWISIPPGQSAAYNQNPTKEKRPG